MTMCDFLVREAIILELAASSKEGVIREMVGSLGAAGAFRGVDPEEVVRAVLKREAIATTGIGRGVAIPHAKHGGVEHVTGTLAISHGGVCFTSLDGKPVSVFVLVISPPDRAGEHLRALEIVTRTLRDDRFLLAVRSATTREAIGVLLDQKGRG